MRFIGGLVLVGLFCGGLSSCGDPLDAAVFDERIAELPGVGSHELDCYEELFTWTCEGEVGLTEDVTADQAAGVARAAVELLAGDLDRMRIDLADPTWSLRLGRKADKGAADAARLLVAVADLPAEGVSLSLVRESLSASVRLTESADLRAHLDARDAVAAAGRVNDISVQAAREPWLVQGGSTAPTAAYDLARMVADRPLTGGFIDPTAVQLVTGDPATVPAVESALKAAPTYGDVAIVDVSATADLRLNVDTIADRRRAVALARAVRGGPGEPKVYADYPTGNRLLVADYAAMRTLVDRIAGKPGLPGSAAIIWELPARPGAPDQLSGDIQGDEIPWSAFDRLVSQGSWAHVAYRGDIDRPYLSLTASRPLAVREAARLIAAAGFPDEQLVIHVRYGGDGRVRDSVDLELGKGRVEASDASDEVIAEAEAGWAAGAGG